MPHEDESYIEMYDFEHSMDEDRYIAIGMVGDLLFVVFTEREENIRLISARLAMEKEKHITPKILPRSKGSLSEKKNNPRSIDYGVE